MAFVSPTHPTRRLCLAIIGGVALQSLSLVQNVVPVWAQAGQTASEPNRPAYQIGSAGRFNEDWSSLRGVDLGKTDDFWDRLKFIPLTEDGSVWFTLGGQARERAEYFRQFQFGASEPKQSDAYLLSRFRLTADLHVTPYFRMFAEGKSAFALDRELQGGRTTAFVDEFDLLNGFADIVIPFGEQASATLRGGRQELISGSQRLAGPAALAQAPRASGGGDVAVRNGGPGRHRGVDGDRGRRLLPAGPAAVTPRLSRIRLCERRQEARRRRRHLQPALPERPLVPWVHRLHRAAEHHQS